MVNLWRTLQDIECKTYTCNSPMWKKACNQFSCNVVLKECPPKKKTMENSSPSRESHQLAAMLFLWQFQRWVAVSHLLPPHRRIFAWCGTPIWKICARLNRPLCATLLVQWSHRNCEELFNAFVCIRHNAQCVFLFTGMTAWICWICYILFLMLTKHQKVCQEPGCEER